MRKIRKVVKGKKKKTFGEVGADIRNYKLPEPVRKVYANKSSGQKSKGGRKRIKFGTRTIPKTVYDPLTTL